MKVNGSNLQKISVKLKSQKKYNQHYFDLKKLSKAMGIDEFAVYPLCNQFTVEDIAGEDANKYFSRAIFAETKQQYDQALSYYSKAIAMSPQQGSFFYCRARLYIKQQDYDKAIEDLTATILLNTDYTSGYDTCFYCRGNLYAQKQEYHKAIADYDQAIEAGEKDNAVYFKKGVLCEKIGHVADAHKAYSLFVRFHENSQDPKLQYAIDRINEIDVGFVKE